MKYTIEIRAAEGGEDSRLFTRTLAEAYTKTIYNCGWESRVVLESLNEIHILVEGDNLEQLLNETGGHRLQRTPPTEKKGRVHTSTVTVAVIEFQDKNILEILDKDIKIEWFSGTGAGGQFRNKKMNSVRLIHIPTNITVTAQCRSRQNSLDQAKTELIKRLQKETLYKQYKEESELRKQQVGSGMRGDKIRTYRFQDDITVDHKMNIKLSTKVVLDGNIHEFWE